MSSEWFVIDATQSYRYKESVIELNKSVIGLRFSDLMIECIMTHVLPISVLMYSIYTVSNVSTNNKV